MTALEGDVPALEGDVTALVAAPAGVRGRDCACSARGSRVQGATGPPRKGATEEACLGHGGGGIPAGRVRRGSQCGCRCSDSAPALRCIVWFGCVGSCPWASHKAGFIGIFGPFWATFP
ncbi:hypothetical protein T484DRAFT_3076365 [Baffinella frigidus]|nr:hypothetical protein T484DRAFT_3076365 [Cryptophyta sp. CCMP2293]